MLQELEGIALTLLTLRMISIKFLLVISICCLYNRVVMKITDMITQDEFA